jgi:hypothetical protein
MSGGFFIYPYCKNGFPNCPGCPVFKFFNANIFGCHTFYEIDLASGYYFLLCEGAHQGAGWLLFRIKKLWEGQ